MKKKNGNRFSTLAIGIGIFLSLISFLIYKFYNIGYLGEIHSEIAGVGVGVLALGLGYKIFKIKLS